MENKILQEQDIEEFKSYLVREEKSAATVEKYLRDVRAFLTFVNENAVTKEQVLAWKEKLVEDNYAVRSVNSMLASINSLLVFLDLGGCRVKNLKTQRQTYCPEEKELTKAEYMRLLKAAEKQPQLKMIMETICGTGIRVSELQYFTVEGVKRGRIEIRCKGKIRTILVASKLRKRLLEYNKKNGIKKGAIFVTRSGKPVDRSNIWARMKKLCETAGVEAGKVFPHNLRKLFARTFYGLGKDIAKLADILGHSSIGTTRIYIMTTGSEHLRELDQLGLIV